MLQLILRKIEFKAKLIKNSLIKNISISLFRNYKISYILLIRAIKFVRKCMVTE